MGSTRSFRRFRVLPVSFALILGFLLPPQASAETLPVRPSAASAIEAEDSYLTGILETADTQKLFQDRYWHILLHYKRGIFGLRSLIDDPKFFADPNGKHDPRAELRATIRSFFRPVVEGETHPVCRFVARFEWLKEKLNIDESRLPVSRCEESEALLEQIRPESVTLIFPTSHINSPASMYGHTLLTIETASKSRLLAYAVNYSALIQGETFAPIYIGKGLLGGYPGYYSILPYYAKLQEYSDVDDRDIWEYPLNLDRAEVRRLILHIAEMEDIYSRYYFFGENCSYGLMFLLEAARPSLHLTDQFGWWVIPLDTIRAMKASGLITEAVYRPSKSTKINYLSALLTSKLRQEAWEVTQGKREPAEVLAQDIQKEEKIRLLDLASENLQYVYTKGKLEKDLYLPRFLKTLEARSTLGDTGDWRYSIPPPGRPDEGHRSKRLAAGLGMLETQPFWEIRLRPAYHSLLDSDRGYKRGSQIIFLDPSIRYYPRRNVLALDGIDLIDIESIAPRNRFFKHISWKVRTGFYRRSPDNPREHLSWSLNPGLGRAYNLPLLGLSYALLEGDFRIGGALAQSYSLGGGASAGVIKQLTGRWKAHLLARYLDYPLGDKTHDLRLRLGQSIMLGTNLGLAVTIERNTQDDDSSWETKLSGNLWF